MACASRHGRTQHEKTRLTSTARAKSRSNDRTKRENRRGTRQRGRVERHAHTQPRTDHQTRRSSETQNPVSSGRRRPHARASKTRTHAHTHTDLSRRRRRRRRRRCRALRSYSYLERRTREREWSLAAARIATRIVVIGGAQVAARAARNQAARRLATRRRLADPRSRRHLQPPGPRHVGPPPSDCYSPNFYEFALGQLSNTCLQRRITVRTRSFLLPCHVTCCFSHLHWKA